MPSMETTSLRSDAPYAASDNASNSLSNGSSSRQEPSTGDSVTSPLVEAGGTNPELPMGTAFLLKPASRRRLLLMSLLIPFLCGAPVVAICYFVVFWPAGSQPASQPPGDNMGPHRSHHRDTLDIVSTCLSTMAICVISVMHFPVFEDDTHRKSFLQRLISRAFWALLLCKVYIWVLYSILVPEMLAAHACMEYLHALDDVKCVKKITEEENIELEGEWTMKHAFFALMGGLKLRDGSRIIPILSGRQLLNTKPEVMRSLDLKVLEDDISDKSKANLLAKLLSISHLLRFTFEIGSRWLGHLQISPLEWITCTYGVCAFITYFFWMKKPFDVEEAVYLDAEQPHTYAQRQSAGHEQQVGSLADESHAGRDIESHAQPTSTDEKSETIVWAVAALVTCLTSIILASGHLASWNIQLPRPRGQLLWRVCSAYLVLGPFTILPFTPLNPAGYRVFRYCWRRLTDPGLRSNDPKFKSNTLLEPSTLCLILLITIYVVARWLLIILVAYSFLSLPKDVYKVADLRWLHFIPFFSA